MNLFRKICVLVTLFGLSLPYAFDVVKQGRKISDIIPTKPIDILFQLWLALPYLVILLGLGFARAGTRIQSWAMFSAIVATMIGVIGFLDVYLNSSDMAALGLLAIPIFQILAGAGVMGILVWRERKV